ncbi:MAG: hypothetical protein NTV30_10585 [Chloroflexi bacterium]|nr:hypothetical protein [Chloroflexota bacterium]
MDGISNAINCGFGWIIVSLAITGYFLTKKRINESWFFWIVLGTGWALFAVAQTILLANIVASIPFLVAILFCSFILVITSMVLFFIKLLRFKTH